MGHMRRISEFTLRHRRLILVIWTIALIAGLGAAGRVSGRLSQQYRLPGQPGYVANVAMDRLYHIDAGAPPAVPVITLPGGEDARDPFVLTDLRRAFAAVQEQLSAKTVSYVNTSDPRFVAAGGRVTFGLVFAPNVGGGPGAKDLSTAVDAAMRPDLPAGATLGVTGINALSSGGGNGKGVSVLTETLLGAIGALVVLAFVFGSFLAVIPLITAAVAILSTLLIVFGLTFVADVSQIVQFLVDLIGLGLAIDYSLLIITRWREERNRGRDPDEAIHRAMETAGRAVLFSAAAVGIGLLAMVVLPVPFLRSIGYGGLLIPLMSVAVALTLLPVLLSSMGTRIDRPRRRKDVSAGRGWIAWTSALVRGRWWAAAGGIAVVLAFGWSALNLNLGSPASSALARSGPAYTTLQTLERAGVPSGVLTPIPVLTLPVTDPRALAGSLVQLHSVWSATAPADWRSFVLVLPSAETGVSAGKSTVTLVRQAAPHALVGGDGAQTMDFVHAVYGNFSLVLALLAIITFIVLARAFKSVLLPLQAVVFNLLSIGAIYGVLVLVWQKGYGSKPIWGVPATGSITDFVPIMIFAFLYGISMDYEVFILSRIREEYDRSGSTSNAVIQGLGRTGRLVTSAALILFLAFVSLASTPETEIKIFATGLGAGVLLDATVIRALLVPAVIVLCGRWNWWFPSGMARVLRVAPESSTKDHSAERVGQRAESLGATVGGGAVNDT
jgi:putative drug exporter of the RND superfamily